MAIISNLLNAIQLGGATVDYQILFNVAVAAVFALGGWMMGRITKSLDQLDADVRVMPEKYVLKSDYVTALHNIDTKLDKIVEKLDGKADKSK